MPLVTRILCASVLFCFLIHSFPFAATITVAKSGADFTTISAAIKAAQPGDVIKIMDVAIYEEQVTIDSTKYALILTSKDPASLIKPTVKYKDTINVGPRTYAESNVDSLITFDRNGALRIIKARNIVVDGIAVDGISPYPFGYPSIWSNKDPLQHGNAAITIYQSGNVIIRNCDICNAYFGMSFKDRNVEGIFSTANPIDTGVYIPAAGFGKTGNHLIDHNRIHNNSWGMFFESSWDLGSTIRYNLFYENHHANSAFAAKVLSLTAEGKSQPGGAIFFKDVLMSPVAVYNNTFWHNYLIIAGHWQAGYQHLVFNNIFGPPNTYWGDSTGFYATVMELTPVLVNRIYNSVFSAQFQAPQQNSVNLLDSLTPLQSPGGTLPDPGTIIVGATAQRSFPAAAANRWLEMDTSLFLSINPASANFLEPNWANENVKSFIVNQGWEKSGVKNTDGTRADLGAIEYVHGTPSFVATIQPGPLPVMLSGTNGQITFSLNQRQGTTLTDPKIKLFRLVKVPYKTQSFGSNEKTMIIPASSLTDLTVPAAPPVKIGPNAYSFSASITNDFAFIEMIIEATGADGKLFTTPAGFLPYRKLAYSFKVEVYDKTGKTAISETHVGDTALLKISPQKLNGDALSDTINFVRVALQSGYKLLSPGNPPQSVEYPDGVTGPTDKLVIFTKIPENGYECISVAGCWRNPGTGPLLSIFGGAAIKVLPAGTAINSEKTLLSSRNIDVLPHEVTIKCFDLQGRRIYQKTFLSDMGLSLVFNSIQKIRPGTASKVYLMDISVKDRVSLKQARSVRKIIPR
jgi:hypothetical protein